MINVKTTALSGLDKEFALSTIKGMNTGRLSYDTAITRLNPLDPINKYWLLGFIEGEGTFGLKNLVPYFQIGQHERSTYVMEDIRLYLKNIPNLFGFTLNSPFLNSSTTIHKNTKVIVDSYNNIDSLYDTLAYFLLDLRFQTRKGTDFLY